LHIDWEAERGERGKGIFEVSISQLTSVRFPVKVWVMANNLREICVCRAAQRMWEDKVHQDAFGIRDRVGLKTFCIMDSFGRVDVRYRVSSKSSCKLHRRFGEIKANVFVVGTKGKSGTKTGGEFVRKERIGFTEEANIFV